MSAMAVATVTNKGQITIPKAVRDTLGLQTGDKLEFVVTNEGQAICRPIARKVDDVFGTLHRPGRKAVSVEEMDVAVKRKVRATFK